MVSLEKQKLVAAALNKLKSLEKTDVFDGNVPNSRPTDEQQKIIDAVRDQIATIISVRAGNQSGKSQTMSRIVAWFLEESFPNWTRPIKWHNEPLQILILGRTFKQIEDSLWRKIEALLVPGTYKVHRQAGVISKVTHDNGNTLLFFSHDNVNMARERIQSFSSHIAWIDELPRSVKLIEEVQRRIQAKAGTMLLSYTPKSPSPDIKAFIEGMRPPVGKEFKLSVMKNPVYSEQEKQNLKDSLNSLSEAYRNTVLFGDWMTGDSLVYEFDYETMVMAPPDYHPSWRHAEASDPALSSAHGLVVAAEHPSTGKWYVIKADYIKGVADPEDLVEEVMSRTAGINIVRRICDPHEKWYTTTALKKGLTYLIPYKKHERKKELIKNLQIALGSKLFIAPWCTTLIDELTSCHYTDDMSDKIAKSSRFHTADAAQYLVDLLPTYEGRPAHHDWFTELRMANTKRKAQEKSKTGPKPYVSFRVRRRR